MTKSLHQIIRDNSTTKLAGDIILTNGYIINNLAKLEHEIKQWIAEQEKKDA